MWKQNGCGLWLAGIWLTLAPIISRAQKPSPTPSPGEMEAAEVIVSATRTEIPEEESPASVSVITSEDFEQKQIERVSDALLEVP
jgi:outer membrane cobalamin receptor